MAKAKPKKAQSNPSEWSRKPAAFGVRGSAEWKSWVERGAEYNRVSVATLIDAALAKYLRDSGFADPPPER